MTLKKAHFRIITAITFFLVTILFIILKVSKLKLGLSIFGFMFCFIISLFFSFKTLKLLKNNNIENKINTNKPDFYDWITFLANSMMFMFILFMFFILPSNVSQTSMSPTLNNNERVLIYHFSYKPKRGDIVIIKMSEIDNPRVGGLENDRTYFVKRIVAIPGDLITFKHINNNIYNVYINNELYKNKYGESYEIKEYQKADLLLDLDNNIVKTGMYLVFGDNEKGSQDSRSFGPIYEKDIIGEVIYKIWPVGKVD